MCIASVDDASFLIRAPIVCGLMSEAKQHSSRLVIGFGKYADASDGVVWGVERSAGMGAGGTGRGHGAVAKVIGPSAKELDEVVLFLLSRVSFRIQDTDLHVELAGGLGGGSTHVR